MAKTGRSPRKNSLPAPSVSLREPDVMNRIAETAYHLWEKRGRPHGSDQRDWLEAERIVMGPKA